MYRYLFNDHFKYFYNFEIILSILNNLRNKIINFYLHLFISYTPMNYKEECLLQYYKTKIIITQIYKYELKN